MNKINALIFLAAFLFLIRGNVNGQISVAEKSVSNIKIEQNLKDILVQRFNAYVQYQTEKNYEKQFELIYPKLIASPDCKKFYFSCVDNKEDFIKNQKSRENSYGDLTGIILLDSQKKFSKERNQIIFTVSLKYGEYAVGQGYIDVYLYNNQWYFGTFYTIDY